MFDWNKKINDCILCGLRAAAHSGTDPVSHRTVQDLRNYLYFSTPARYTAQATRAIEKINAMEHMT